MCLKTGELGAPSAPLRGGTIEMFLNMPGYVRFSSPVFWEPAHQLNELLGGGSKLRLRQCRAQLRHHLVAHRDLNLGAGILSHLANQLGQSFARFADREFHSDEVYKGVQTESIAFPGLFEKIGWRSFCRGRGPLPDVARGGKSRGTLK